MAAWHLVVQKMNKKKKDIGVRHSQGGAHEGKVGGRRGLKHGIFSYPWLQLSCEGVILFWRTKRRFSGEDCECLPALPSSTGRAAWTVFAGLRKRKNITRGWN